MSSSHILSSHEFLWDSFHSLLGPLNFSCTSDFFLESKAMLRDKVLSHLALSVEMTRWLLTQCKGNLGGRIVLCLLNDAREKTWCARAGSGSIPGREDWPPMSSLRCPKRRALWQPLAVRRHRDSREGGWDLVWCWLGPRARSCCLLQRFLKKEWRLLLLPSARPESCVWEGEMFGRVFTIGTFSLFN